MAVALCYIVCALVWSTTWFAIRVCIGPGGYPTYAAAAIRFAVAGAILVALVQLGLGRPWPSTRRQVVALVAAGLCNAVSYACVYTAETSLPGGLVAVVFSSYPLFTALGAALTGTERVRPIDVAAAAVSLAGMTLLFWDRLSISPDQALGVGLTLASVLATVVYALIMKREAAGVGSLASTAVFLSVAALGLLAPALAEPGGFPLPPPPAPTAALLYLAVFGSVVTFGCYFYMLRRVSLMTAASLVLIEPILALLVDALWEDKVRLDLKSYAGAVVTFAGVAVGITWKWRAARREVVRPGAG